MLSEEKERNNEVRVIIACYSMHSIQHMGITQTFVQCNIIKIIFCVSSEIIHCSKSLYVIICIITIVNIKNLIFPKSGYKPVRLTVQSVYQIISSEALPPAPFICE
jgi:hypothetical protein